jgi:tetratricopeptide (TPR) repeat protein
MANEVKQAHDTVMNPALNQAKQYMRRSLWMIQELEHSVNLVPDEAERYYGLALICIMLGKFKEAIKNLSSAIEAAPNNLSALYLLGEMNLKLSRYEQAAAVFERVVSHKPENLAAITELCLAYHCLGERGRELSENSILQTIAPDLIATVLKG